jgi:hypothetical protein
MKSILIGLLAPVLIVTTASANAKESPFSGPYVGAEAGLARSTTKYSLAPATGTAILGSSQKNSFNFGGYLGYGHVFSGGAYLGGELGLNRSAGKVKAFSVGGISPNERVRYDATASVHMGYAMGDSLVYGILGADRRSASYQLPGGTSRTENVTGRTFGIGVAQSFGNNLVGRVELERVDHGKKSLNNNLSYDPAATRLTVGVAYRF